MSLQFNLVGRADGSNIVVVVDGEMHVADNNHPNWDAIVAGAQAGDETVVDLFDASRKAAAIFEKLSDRVTVANSRVYVDQTEVEDAFADQIIRFMDEGVDDWQPLVKFLEKAYSNTSKAIRDNLSRWLNAEKFTILPNGNILGYRGLREDFTSVHAGPGIVNGVSINGNLDNSVGNTVEIDATIVDDNPSVGCSVGLHVGTFAYAKGWSRGQLVSVEVDPRHVRSVPFDCNSQKMRVSKYNVLESVESKTDDVVSYDYGAYEPDFDEYEADDDDYDWYTYPNDGYSY